jgi:hypothetical protein
MVATVQQLCRQGVCVSKAMVGVVEAFNRDLFMIAWIYEQSVVEKATRTQGECE